MGFIVLLRPLNILVVLFLPIFHYNFSSFIHWVKSLIVKPVILSLSFLSFLAVLSIQFIIYKIQIDQWFQKLSVAVVVDYVLDENGERIALDQGRIDQINALVREAIGFSAERGDSVQVINSPFIAPDPIEPIPEPGLFEQAWVWELGRGNWFAEY